MKNIKNAQEIDKIKEMIDNNRFCLNNCLLEADKLTNDRINNLDIDTIEDITLNQIRFINVWEAKKDKMNYKFTQYLLNADVYINDDLYRIKNWFTYDKKNNYFEDAEVFADNDYMYN